jgi:hypothetical protein
MKMRLLGALVVLTAVIMLDAVSIAGQAPAAARTNATATWTPPRTPDGQPDLQGYWSSATYTPFERPAELKDKEFFTPEEAAAYAKRRDDQFRNQAADAIHYDDAIWQGENQAKGLTSLRTSLVVEPRDGKVPPMTADGQKRAADRAAARRLIGPADSAQTRALSERCIIWPHEGPPMLPVGYNSNLSFVQGPGYVVVIQEMTHNARVISLDGRPHIGKGIQQYRGDSRGRWEGNTLIVETTNFTDKTAYRGSSPALKVTERFAPLDPNTIRYEFTIDDPATWATPWKAEYHMRRTNDMVYEYACHEGNYGLANILRAQRVADEAAKAKATGSTQP